MPRKRLEWLVQGRTILLGERTLAMGIVNVTPDSFSDGGQYYEPDLAYARALELEEQGAAIIDIGAESTRPGSARISEAEELRRLIPVMKRLRGKLSVPISVDTYKAGVARKAVEYGAQIINDPSGLTFDPEIVKAAVEADAGLIINHMRGAPDTWLRLPPLPDVMGAVFTDLEAAVHRAVRAGLNRRQIVIDPGFGFGKRGQQNAEILARLEELGHLNLPIMAGLSRKSFLKQESGHLTCHATSAALTAAVLKGAHMVRVHDLPEAIAALQVADSILSAEESLAAHRAREAPIRTGRPAGSP
jgi:dihydropteroate synthase